jgi:flap endonuclease-1
MGIKNLMKLINKYAPHSIKLKKISDYKDKTLGIDTNLMIYKNIYAIKKKTRDIYNDDTIITHIHTILLKIIKFKEYNITPIFVFDGEPPYIKEDMIRYREHMLRKYKDDKKYYFMYAGISYQEISEIRELIKSLGYTIVDAPQEADSQLAHMSMNKEIDYIVSDDLDILVFGGSNILKNFTVNMKKDITEINLDILKKDLQITQDQLIDIAILSGSDYLYKQKIKNIGPIKSFKLIIQYQSIERSKLNTNNLDYKSIRFYFKNPLVLNNTYYKTGIYNKEKIKELLDYYKYKETSSIKKKLIL